MFVLPPNLVNDSRVSSTTTEVCCPVSGQSPSSFDRSKRSRPMTVCPMPHASALWQDAAMAFAASSGVEQIPEVPPPCVVAASALPSPPLQAKASFVASRQEIRGLVLAGALDEALHLVQVSLHVMSCHGCRYRCIAPDVPHAVCTLLCAPCSMHHAVAVPRTT